MYVPVPTPESSCVPPGAQAQPPTYMAGGEYERLPRESTAMQQQSEEAEGSSSGEEECEDPQQPLAGAALPSSTPSSHGSSMPLCGRSCRAPPKSLGLLVVALCAATATAVVITPTAEQQQQHGAVSAAAEQWFYIVRHGDKFSSYPDCGPTTPPEGPCFNGSLMGNNPPLTPCGVRQSTAASTWLQRNASAVGGIQHIVSSPYVRSLETALPLATKLGLALNVENLVSEARNADAAFRPDNILLPGDTQTRLAGIRGERDAVYPHATPHATPHTLCAHDDF
jgi:hypothetical protein